jgi:hypothetical protein
MLIPISIEENKINTSDIEISNYVFKDLKLKEEYNDTRKLDRLK